MSTRLQLLLGIFLSLSTSTAVGAAGYVKNEEVARTEEAALIESAKVPEETVKEWDEADKKEEEKKAEEKKKEEEKKQQEKEAASGQNASTTVNNTNSSQPVWFAEHAVALNDAAAQANVDYKYMMEHKCPSQRPAKEYPYQNEYFYVLPVIGLSNANEYRGTADSYKDYVEVGWDYMKNTGTGSYTLGNAYGIGMSAYYPELNGCNPPMFYIDSAGNAGYTRGEYLNAQGIAKANELANKISQYAKWLNSKFYATCPNG